MAKAIGGNFWRVFEQVAIAESDRTERGES